ncbi:MAG: peptidyl-prolyl cis-trans isomerase [Chloroflexi bacterium]|nr:peptidyl-prolyl cis-trans isomerase [Chloroflexota bacterium]
MPLSPLFSAQGSTSSKARRRTRSFRKPLIFNFDPALTRAEREQRRTQWVVALSILTFIVVLIIGGIGFYINDIRTPRLPVAEVNGYVIQRSTWQHYEALLQFEINQQLQQIQTSQPPTTSSTAAAQQQAKVSQLQQQLQGAAQQAANDLIDFRIVQDGLPVLEKSGAPASALVPSEKQLQDALATEKERLGVTTQQQLNSTLAKIGMSQAGFHQILVDRQTIANVKAYLNRDLQEVQPQVSARIMTFGSKASADKALAELHQGQSWGQVNLQFAKDPSANETSRTVAWTPAALQDKVFDTFAFHAKPLQISSVLPDNGAFDIIQVIDVGPARPLTPTQVSDVKQKIYSDWLAQQSQHAKVQRYPENMTA